jgi:hypothetical protein
LAERGHTLRILSSSIGKARRIFGTLAPANRRTTMLSRVAALGLLICLLPLSGCTTGGAFLAQNQTNVELAGDNFNIVAKDVVGSAYADYLLGLGSSAGAASSTLALVRVGGTATLYNDAVTSLWRNFEERYGSAEGRNLVLANVRYDADVLNLIVFTKTTVYIHADVVEFNQQ